MDGALRWPEHSTVAGAPTPEEVAMLPKIRSYRPTHAAVVAIGSRVVSRESEENREDRKLAGGGAETRGRGAG